MPEIERKYMTLFELAPAGISVVDSEKNIVEANTALWKILRIPLDSLKKKIYRNRKYINSEGKLMLPDEFPSAIALREKKLVRDIEIGIIDDEKDPFWVEVSSAPLDNEGKFAILITQDITERKNAEKALHESREWHFLLMENSGLGIAYYSPEGKILMFNQMAIKNMGGVASDYIGKNLVEVFGKEVGCGYCDRLKLAAASEKPIKFEDYVELGGIPGWYVSTHCRILDQNGKVDGIQVISDNITDLKIAEKNLKESNKKLQNLAWYLEGVREKERSQLAMNLHDEFGQRLTALNMNIAWMKTRIGVQSPPVREKLDEMSLMVSETIESIREVASSLRPSILYEMGLVAGFFWHLKKIEEQSGIKCHLSSKPKTIKINKVIALILYRVLQESLTNVLKHAGASEVKVNLLMKGNKIDMLIEDNGIGIDNSKIQSYTSMGLAGIRERVLSVGGTVIINGIKGSGTTVKVSIDLNNKEKK